MAKFKKGDQVIYEGSLATITEVHDYLPTSRGPKKMIWYSVTKEGFRSSYAVSQKTGSLKKVNPKKVKS
jgi:hypothetical protein